MSKKVYVIKEARPYDVPENLRGLISFLQTHLDSVPEEFRDQVTMDIDTDQLYDVPYTEISIHYYRPFTQEEVEEERQKQAKVNEVNLRFKRDQLEKLKRELGEY